MANTTARSRLETQEVLSSISEREGYLSLWFSIYSAPNCSNMCRTIYITHVTTEYNYIKKTLSHSVREEQSRHRAPFCPTMHAVNIRQRWCNALCLQGMLPPGFPTMPEMPAIRPDEFYADQHVKGPIRLLSSW